MYYNNIYQSCSVFIYTYSFSLTVCKMYIYYTCMDARTCMYENFVWKIRKETINMFSYNLLLEAYLHLIYQYFIYIDIKIRIILCSIKAIMILEPEKTAKNICILYSSIITSVRFAEQHSITVDGFTSCPYIIHQEFVLTFCLLNIICDVFESIAMTLKSSLSFFMVQKLLLVS